MRHLSLHILFLLLLSSFTAMAQLNEQTDLDSLLQHKIQKLEKQIEDQAQQLHLYEKTISDFAIALTEEREKSALLEKYSDSLTTFRDFSLQLLKQDIPDISVQIKMFNNTFDAYIVDTRQREVEFFLMKNRRDNWGSLGTLKDGLFAQDSSVLIFATNGGMYDPNRQPQGLYIEDGKIIKKIDQDTSGYGNFYLHPNGIFFITQGGKPGIYTTAVFDTMNVKMKYATQSGPMLVIDEQHHPVFTPGSRNKYVRSGVGLLDEHRLVFIISNRPVNFFDFASLFRDYFHCKQALYLDGNISKTYLPALNRHETGGSFGPIIGVRIKDN